MLAPKEEGQIYIVLLMHHSWWRNFFVTEVLPEPLGPAMMINSGLCIELLIDYTI